MKGTLAYNFEVLATQQGWFKDEFYVAGFERDPNGIYHARQDCLQQYAGYNDLYDDAFNLGTDMKPAKFPFKFNGKDYILWAWKGDYLNLGAGAELGIYSRLSVGGIPTEHWLADTDDAMPMTLSLYDQDGNEIYPYNPSEPQWWVTGWNPFKQNRPADHLTAVYSLNFSNNPDMFTSFYNTWNSDERWKFYPDSFIATFTF